MQSYVDEYQLNVDSELPIEVEQALQAANDPDMMPDQPLPVAAEEIFTFEARFKGQMVMHSPAQAVADYLSTHEDWFPACAQPMHAEPLGENGYVLTIGSFGAFGYEVEPKMGVVLQPPAAGVYHMHSIPVPDYTPPAMRWTTSGYALTRARPARCPLGYCREHWGRDCPARVAVAAWRHDSLSPLHLPPTPALDPDDGRSPPLSDRPSDLPPLDLQGAKGFPRAA